LWKSIFKSIKAIRRKKDF